MSFSFAALLEQNPSLASLFVWATNHLEVPEGDIAFHVGCGDNVMDDFVNIDFLPINERVQKFNLLNPWGAELENRVLMAFSEDVMEHFFYNEQMYILCQMNIALKQDAVYRILMPSVEKLNHYYNVFDPKIHTKDWLSSSSGFITGADVLNFGLRMSGHRWLHDNKSMQVLGARCGYEVVATTCDESTNPKLSRRNLRNETNSFSFANDMIKRRALKHAVIPPTQVVNATQVEKIGPDSAMFRADNADPQVYYYLPQALETRQIALMVFRFANLTEFDEHSFAKVYFKMDEACSLYFDLSLRSNHHLSMFSNAEISRVIQPEAALEFVRLDPAEHSDQFFILGPCEVFYFE
jgi:hypothetical protein